MPLLTSPAELSSQLGDAPLYILGPAGVLLGWFAKQFLPDAKLNQILLDASRTMLDDLQKRHASDFARNSELEERTIELEAEILRLRGELRQAVQREESVRALVDRHLEVPPKRS